MTRRERTLAEYREAMAVDPSASFYTTDRRQTHRAGCAMTRPDCAAAHPGGRLPEPPPIGRRLALIRDHIANRHALARAPHCDICGGLTDDD